MIDKKTVVIFMKDEPVLDAIASFLSSAGYNIFTYTSTWAFLESRKQARQDFLICSENACGTTLAETMQVLESTGWSLPAILINPVGEALMTTTTDNEVEKLASLLDNFAESRTNLVATA